MKLQNVKEDSWVMYNNKPYFVIYIPNGTKRRVLRNNDGNMKVSVKANVEHAKVPKYQVGDVVTCIDDRAPEYGQQMTITKAQYSAYAAYELDGHKWSTPFNIVKVNY